MYHCKLCSYKSKAFVDFTCHMKLHSNVPNHPFTCGVPNCTRSFRKFSAFSSHIYRDHRSKQIVEQNRAALTCQVEDCKKTFADRKSLIHHLRGHIREGRKITCPFRGCYKVFGVLNSFSVHVSRLHKESSFKHVDETREQTVHQEQFDDASVLLRQSSMSAVENENEIGACSESADDPSMPLCPPSTSGMENEEIGAFNESVNEDLFLKSLSLFYLKLQTKLVLPASVIQTIVEEVQQVHDEALSHLFSKLKEKLSVVGLPDNAISFVIDELQKHDLFRKGNHVLRSDQRRKSVFKKSFKYVEPLPIYLGKNDSAKDCYAYYIPVQDTLASLFE